MYLNISGGFLGLRGRNRNLNIAYVGIESKADIRRWNNNGARSTERYEDIIREERV